MFVNFIGHNASNRSIHNFHSFVHKFGYIHVEILKEAFHVFIIGSRTVKKEVIGFAKYKYRKVEKI